MFFVLGVIWTVGLVYFGTTFLARSSAYDSAPICNSAADISHCRYQGPAHIVRMWTHKSNPAVDVAFDQLEGRMVSTDLDQAYTSQWQSWHIQDQVTAELWDGRLTVVAGLKTFDNPSTFPASNYALAEWISGAITLAFGGLFAWLLVLYRRAARVHQSLLSESAVNPAVVQELPLTAAFTGYLQSEVVIAKNPLQTILFTLGLAAIIPTFFSIVFLIQGQLFNGGTVIIWSVFLAGGGLLAFYLLHETGLESRDIAGGVFVRSTGPFEINLITSRYGTAVQVVVGGRKLSNAVAHPLDSIQSGTGTVDYLPVSGELLEVRDESGQVLWSRLSDTQSTTS